MAFAPLPFNSSASVFSRSARRAPSTTSAPCADRCRAVASPSPLLAPVMTTTLPAMGTSVLQAILLVRHLLKPLDHPAVEPLLNRDVRHRRRLRRAMPVLLARRKPDDVAGTDLFDRASPSLREAAAGGDDERLPERMRVPRRPRAGLERHVGARDARGIRRSKQRIDAHGAGEPVRRSCARGLRSSSLDVHG